MVRVLARTALLFALIPFVNSSSLDIDIFIRACPNSIETISFQMTEETDKGYADLVGHSIEEIFLQYLTESGHACVSETVLMIHLGNERPENISYASSESSCCRIFQDTTERRRALVVDTGPPLNSNVFLSDAATGAMTKAITVKTRSSSFVIFEPVTPENSDLSFNNLLGNFFDIGILNYPPYTVFPQGEAALENVTGFSMDLLDILATSMNFTFQLHFVDNFGSLQSDGSWNGIVGALTRRDLDFGGSLIQCEKNNSYQKLLIQ